MISFMLKYKKVIAVFLAVCILGTMIPMLADLWGRTPIADANEGKIAADISTSTGVDVEKVLMLRKGGKSWNEILEYLKGKGGSAEDRDEMDMILTEEVLGEEDVKLLIDAGFTKEEIQQATLIAERVQFQLQEITLGNDSDIISDAHKVPEVGEIDDLETEYIIEYEELYEKFSVKTVTIFMIKLNNSFGSMEQVMDEYLYSLQVDINLEDYITNSKTYLDKKNDRSLEVASKMIITMSDIENEMLKAIQQQDVNNDIIKIPNSNMNPSDNKDLKSDEGPASPLPEMEDVTPQNPLEDILEEIQQINPLE